MTAPDDGDGNQRHQEAVLDRWQHPLDSIAKCPEPGHIH